MLIGQTGQRKIPVIDSHKIPKEKNVIRRKEKGC